MRLDHDVFQEGPMATFGETEYGARAVFFGALHALGGIGARVVDHLGNVIEEDYRIDNDRYEPAFDTWRSCTDMPSPRRFGHAGFVLGNDIHITGGQSQYAGLIRDHNVYHPIGDYWEAMEPLLEGMGSRFLHAGFAIDGIGYVCGGRQPYGVAPGNTDAYLSDTDTWEARDGMSDPVGEHVAIAVDDAGYAFGGSPGGPFPAIIGTTQSYDPQTDLWNAELELFAPGRREHSGARVGRDSFYGMIFGGHSDEPEIYTSFADRYDPGSDSWERRTELPYPARHWSSSAGIEDSAYVVGGVARLTDVMGPPDWNHLRDCDEYNNQFDSWSERSNMPAYGRGRLEVLSVTV